MIPGMKNVLVTKDYYASVPSIRRFIVADCWEALFILFCGDVDSSRGPTHCHDEHD